jgi:GT2 family glycosyltransferase
MLARLLTLLGQVASGGDGIAAMLALDNDLGAQITALNRTVTAGLTARPFIQRFGPEGPAPKGSIIVCLHGRAEYQFTQNALYANRPGIGDYEFIYVCNSPELLELVLKNATGGTTIYGLRQTVIGLPGNAGFGAANNVGVAAAHSDRILCINPDVFPRDPAWAARHTALVAQGGDGSRLFGAMLFYDDGSLMHGGMYFEVDTGLAIRGGRVQSAPLVRVEHFGKGAPPDTAPFLRPRPVAAVSGAFISIGRALYERLGGFSPEFVLGHYEDADLCLRAMQLGVVPWVQDVKMWHLEGQGSRRNMQLPGANLVNRWLFSRRWSALIRARLTGPAAEPCSLASEPTAETA